MSLTLKVVTFKGQPPHEPLTMIFDRQGGTIGRSKSADFVLPDPDRFLSRKHAEIIFKDNSCYLKDTSLSGSYIRNKKLQVHQNQVELEDGDFIEVGDYVLSVELERVAADEEFEELSSLIETEAAHAGAPMPANTLYETGGKPFHQSQQKKIAAYIQAEKVINEKMKAISFDRTEEVVDEDPYPSEINELVAEGEAGLTGIFESLQLPDSDNDIFLAEGSILLKTRQGRLTDDDSRDTPLFEKIQLTQRNDVIPQASHRSASSADIAESMVDEDNLLSIVQEFIEKVSPFLPLESGQLAAPADHRKTGPKPQDRVTEETPKVKPESIKNAQEVQRLPQSDSPPSELFGNFLQAAGIEDTDFYEEEDITRLLRNTGEIFRALVQGLMALTSGRAESKKQLRMQGTILGPVDNNPIKFSHDIADTIKMLILEDQDGYLGGAEAVRKCYGDITGHQLAMTAGIQAALKKALKRFDPERYDSHGSKGFAVFKKAAAWDAYCKEYPDIVIKTLENLLDDEFVRVYDEQIQKMGRLKDVS